MGILSNAGRMLIQKASEKVLKDTNVGKKVVKAITSNDKPQTPQGEGLSFGGTTSQSYIENRNQEVQSSIRDLPVSGVAQDYLNEAEKDDSLFMKEFTKDNPFLGFKSLESRATINSNNAQAFRDNFSKATSGDNKAREALKNSLSKEGFDKYSKWTSFVSQAKLDILSKGNEEGKVEGGVSSLAKRLPFGEPVTDVISKGTSKVSAMVAEGSFSAERFPSFSETEYAKEQLANEGKYKKATGSRIVGGTIGLLAGYGAYGKVADATLLGNKALAGTRFQAAMQESYVKNPFLFNLTSNSAQEAIEYGARKGLGDENISLSDLVMGMGAGAIFSKVFSKGMDNIFDGITTKDLSKVNDAIKKAKEINPNATSQELAEAANDVTLNNGMNFGTLKKTFAKVGGNVGDGLATTFDSTKRYFNNLGVNLSTRGSKRLTSVINQTNEVISKQSGKQLDPNVKDISLFKQDILTELSGKNQLSYDDVEEVISRKAKEYGVQLNKSEDKVDMIDLAEEMVMREGSQISNLSNPKTLNGFKETYLGKLDADTDLMRKLDDENALLNTKTGKAAKSDVIKANEAKIKVMLDSYGVKSIDEAETMRYRINNDEVVARAKALRTKGVTGKVTNAEKAGVRQAIINETKALEKEAEDIMNKLSKVKSTNSQGDFAKIIQFTQLKNGVDNGDYKGALRSFVDTNKAALKGDLATAVEVNGGKVLRLNKRDIKRLKLNDESAIRRYSETNGYDGYTTKKLVEGKEEEVYTSLNDNFKKLDATVFWTDIKSLERLRAQGDINEFTKEASLQTDGKFTLSNDEELNSPMQIANFILPFAPTGKKGSRILQDFDNYGNIFDRVFGKDSHITKVIHGDVHHATSNWNQENRLFNASAVQLGAHAKIGDWQRQRKFLIGMVARREGMESRVLGADNFWIDRKTGKIVDTDIDRGIGFTFKNWRGFYSKEKIPEGAERLTPEDVAKIVTEIESDKLFRPLITFFDNKFNDVAGRMNRMHHNDTGVLIPTEKKYFPVMYKNTNYFATGEEPRNSLSQIFTSHVRDGFLNSVKAPPKGTYSLNTDFSMFVKSFGDNQLYYLHMKEPLMRAKRAVRNSNRKGIDIEGIDEGVEFKDNKLEWKDAVKDDVTEGNQIFSPKLKTYVDNYISEMENRGVIQEKAGIVGFGAKWGRNVGTWATIALNPWSVASQTFSMLDAMAEISPASMGRGFRAMSQDFSYGKELKSLKYSGTLAVRQTEHTQGIAIGKFFNKGDLQAISQTKWWANAADRSLEASLRGMRRADGEVSYAVWNGLVDNFLRKNIAQMGDNVKITSDIDELHRTMEPAWFNKMVGYADKEMSRIMGGSQDFVMGSEAKRLGILYKSGTMIQRTFINRMLFLNHTLTQGNAIAIPRVLSVMAVQEMMETEREYLRNKYQQYIGNKEPTKGKDMDFGFMTIRGDSHLADIIATNPSLDFETFESKAYEYVLHGGINVVRGAIDSDYKDNGLSEMEILGARAMGRFIKNSLWNPMSGYELSSIMGGYNKIEARAEKGEEPPQNRADAQISEAVLKIILPNLGDDLVTNAHRIVFNENLWKTEEDNYQLGKLTKGNPEKMDNLNKMSFEEQAKEATTGAGIYESGKVVSEKNAKIKAKSDELIKDMFSIYGVPTKDEIRDYAKKNKEKFAEIGITKVSGLEPLIDDVGEYGRKISTGEESMLPKNIEVIYEYKLKKMAEAGDREGINNAIKELVEAGVIKDKKGTIKKVKGLLKKDGLLGY